MKIPGSCCMSMKYEPMTAPKICSVDNGNAATAPCRFLAHMVTLGAWKGICVPSNFLSASVGLPNGCPTLPQNHALNLGDTDYIALH